MTAPAQCMNLPTVPGCARCGVTAADLHLAARVPMYMDMAPMLSYAAEVSEVLTFLLALAGAWVSARKWLREHRSRGYRPRHAPARPLAQPLRPSPAHASAGLTSAAAGRLARSRRNW
jgi:hypothetical protein